MHVSIYSLQSQGARYLFKFFCIFLQNFNNHLRHKVVAFGQPTCRDEL
jgi:hypothetical protein